MLVKSTFGVNLINIFRKAFMCADPKSIKKTDDLTVFFAHLGSVRTKAACRRLVKSTPSLSFVFTKLIGLNQTKCIDQ